MSFCRAPRWALVTVLLLAGSTLGRAQELDVVYVPTPQSVVERMLEIAKVGPADYVIDLGSGDGRIAVTAGRRGARALGVDLNPDRIAEARANAERNGVADRVTFRQQNLFETDISSATVLTLYLLPELNLRLRPRILALKPGTRVVSHAFSMGDWKADHFELAGRDIYFWVVPARVEGQWQVTGDSGRFTVALKQRYQTIEGTAQIGGRTLALRNPKLDGATIEFTIESEGKPTTYRGRVDGGTIQGLAGGEAKDGAEPATAWQARRG
jgi:SAM-dependent methyltransferase